MTTARLANATESTSMTRLVLLRHGEALGVAERCIGHTDVPLSPDGAAAIRRLVVDGLQSLTGTRSGNVRLVSSDLRRAFESAEILAAVTGCHPVSDARLRELDFGEWDGRSWSEIECSDAERLRSWMQRWTEGTAPAGESVGDLLRRARNWLGDTLTRQSAGQIYVVVSHAGWIRAAVSHLLGYDIAHMFEIPVDHARATVIDVGDSGAVLVASNVGALPGTC